MIKVGYSKRQLRSIVRYFRNVDKRTTAFYRGIATHAARLAAIELNQQIDPNKNPLAKEYKDGVRALRVRGADVIPKHEFGKKKPLTKVQEEHWAAISVRAPSKGSEFLKQNVDNVGIKIKPHSRKKTHTPNHVWPLVRYGPWTVDTIPFMPKPSDALILYFKLSKEEVVSLREKVKKRSLPKAIFELRKYGVATRKMEKKLEGVVAVEELQYYALRREFGMIAGQPPIWRPLIRRLRELGVEYLLKTNSQLWRTLFDPSYTGYGMLGRFHFIDASVVKSFESFQDKVRR